MFALVAVARPFPEPLTYAIPALMAGELQRGHMVLVPLGKLGETGYVVDFVDSIDFDPNKVKPITRLLDPEPAFNAEQLAFFRWIAEYYLSPLGMVIHTAMPSRMKAKVVRGAEATEAGILALTTREAQDELAHVLRELIRRPNLTRRSLVRGLAEELSNNQVEAALRELERRDWLAWIDKEVAESSARVTTARLLVPLDEAQDSVSSTAKTMLSVLGALAETTIPVDVATLVDRFGSSVRASVKKLAERGLIALADRERRDALTDAVALGPAVAPRLNDAQTAALQAIGGVETGTFLLFGVTGSGKTEVFLGAAKTALERGRQVLVLVPEIGLTPQLVGRFKARFGEAVAVLHSGLTAQQRLMEWRRIRAGEAPVAVGARSALFAPFTSLGLIVVDEEHDDSYKQDEGVAYSARDLAVVLGQRHKCPTVLATATPSLESWQNADLGRYTLLELPNRATKQTVPTVELVDMTEEPKTADGDTPIFAARVVDALNTTFERGGKAIVLYNRRGYATQVQCLECGAGWECPNCGISMTLHKKIRRMSCHYCGLSLAYTQACQVCQAPRQEESGKGTEQIAEALEHLFPGIPIARMDADTTKGRGSHHQILEAFRDGETRMLVGTQIVAKGHDFPDVHTAVVVSADRGFRMPDFRAAERTYALLVQLAGRAGRGDTAGNVFVQTWNPDHYVLQHLDDVRGYLKTELRLRATLSYPPYTRLCLVRLDGVDRRAVENAARDLARVIRDASKAHPQTRVLGPAPAALPRLVGRWRFQLILRGVQYRPWRNWLIEVLPLLRTAAQRGIRVSWDVDPRHLM